MEVEWWITYCSFFFCVIVINVAMYNSCMKIKKRHDCCCFTWYGTLLESVILDAAVLLIASAFDLLWLFVVALRAAYVFVQALRRRTALC